MSLDNTDKEYEKINGTVIGEIIDCYLNMVDEDREYIVMYSRWLVNKRPRLKGKVIDIRDRFIKI